MTRSFKTLALLTAVLLGGILWQSTGTGDAAQPSRWGTVLHVRDGDTYVIDLDPPGLQGDPAGVTRVATPNGTGTAVRLRGVNTFADSPGDVDCWGPAATAFVRLPEGEPGGKLGLVGQRVRVVGSLDSSMIDRFGRYPMRVFYNGVDVANTLLKAGLGLPMPAMQLTDKQVTQYRKKAAVAQAANRRIWRPSRCGAGPSKGVVLNMRVMSDADGNDQLSLNGEWVELRNDSPLDSGIDVQLRNWQLRDADWNKFVFPTKTLAPGESVRVYGGSTLPPGAPAGSLSWRNTEEMFLNRSEIVVLMDPDGDIRAYFDWPCNTALKTTTSCDHALTGKVALWAHFNPFGGPDVPEDEWVDIWNTSSEPVNLEGTYIRDDSDTYLFDKPTWVQPGDYLRLRVGKGADGPGVRWWGKSTLILQDEGDRVDLLDLGGRLIACYGWGTETCQKADLDWSLEVIVNYDGEGNNSVEAANNEWIKVWNRGTAARDLTGFLLEIHGELYQIPAGTTLGPGQRLMVRMGTGLDTTLDKHWRMAGSNVIPNPRGTVNLYSRTFRLTGSFIWPCSGDCTPAPIIVSTHCPGINNTDPFEWVRVTNTSASPVDITDWNLRTSQHYHYYFPDGTIIDPGETITVFVFEGDDDGDRLYWGKPDPIIRQPSAGEQIAVYSAHSVLAHTYVSTTTENPGSCGDLYELRLVVNFDGEGSPNGSLNGTPTLPPRETPNTEWIRVWNDGDEAIDLQGFTLQATVLDGFSSDYTISGAFPVVLPPGDSLWIFMGTGMDQALVKYWGIASDSQVLPNGRNVNSVTLWDSTGVRAAVYQWLCPSCEEPEVRVDSYCTGANDSDPNEWVRIRNYSSKTVDLTDWYLKTGRHWHYYFPDGTTIAAGATIRVWTKPGTNTSSDLYWNLPNPILRSAADGETVETWGPRGKSIAVYTWNTTTNPTGNC